MSEKWRVWCNTEFNWVSLWSDIQPESCPNNSGHEINTMSWQNITPYLDSENTIKLNKNNELETSNAIQIKDIKISAENNNPVIIYSNGSTQNLVSSPSKPEGRHIKFLGPYRITSTNFKPIVNESIELPANEYFVVWSYTYEIEIWTDLQVQLLRNNQELAYSQVRDQRIKSSAGGNAVFNIDETETMTFQIAMKVHNKKREPEITNINIYIYPRFLSFKE